MRFVLVPFVVVAVLAPPLLALRMPVDPFVDLNGGVREPPPLQAGFAETDITPVVGGEQPVYLAGFGHNRKATGVHDPLFARAVVLSDGTHKIALVSVDLVGFFYANVLHVRKQLAGFDYVLVSSTHNHEGPDSLGLWGRSPLHYGVDPVYLRRVEQCIVEAVQTADRARQPVRAVLGTARAPELLHDNRLPIVKHDELVAIEFRDARDRVAGVIVQWNCHPETLDSKNTRVSADFVGYTVAHVRRKRRAPVVYLTGTVGGLMTSLKVGIKSDDGKPLSDGTFEKTERYGQLVGELAVRALADAKPVTLTPLEARRREVYLPLNNVFYLSYRGFGILKRDAYLWTGNPYRAESAPGKTKQPLCIQSEIGYLRFGDLDIVAIPGEVYPELVLDKVENPAVAGADFPDAPIEPALYKQLRGPHRMLIGLANDEIGYIIPKRQWDEKPPYCYGRTEPQYGELNSLGPETAPILCEAFRDLVRGR